MSEMDFSTKYRKPADPVQAVASLPATARDLPSSHGLSKLVRRTGSSSLALTIAFYNPVSGSRSLKMLKPSSLF